jgi:hypothetical protein
MRGRFCGSGRLGHERPDPSALGQPGRSLASLLVLAAAALLGAGCPAIELAVLDHERVPRPDVSGEPAQIAESKAPFEHVAGGRRYRLTPRFRWDQSAHVVCRHRYRFGKGSALIPVDLALAWGPILAPPYEGRISYDQFRRFYSWQTRDGSLDRQTIVSHSANTHVIPATSRLRRAVAAVSEGDDVRLEGWLVEVAGISEPGFSWGTSASRDDAGMNSCETVFLERLTVNERAYE